MSKKNQNLDTFRHGWRMSPEELQAWIAKRKKCGTFKSAKDYTRKTKHKNREAE